MPPVPLTWPVWFPCVSVLHLLWQNAPIVMNHHAVCCHTCSFHWLCFFWSSCRMCGGLFTTGLLTDSGSWCSEMESMRQKTWMNLLKEVCFLFMVTLVIWLLIALNSKAWVIPESHDSWESLSLWCKGQSRSPLIWKQLNLSCPAVASCLFGIVFCGSLCNEIV